MSLDAADKCPQCGGSLLGAPIPPENQRFYGGQTHYHQTIGVEYGHGHPERHDGVSEWLCPHCGHREGRWSGRTLGVGEYEPRPGVVSS